MTELRVGTVATARPRPDAGDPAPLFAAATADRPDYAFASVAGRYIVLSFLGSAAEPEAAAFLATMRTTYRRLFDDDRFSFFGVSVDPTDAAEGRVQPEAPGIRFFHDFSLKVSALYGLTSMAGDRVRYDRCSFVLDPEMTVIAVIPLHTAAVHTAELVGLLQSLPPVGRHAGVDAHAPVLMIPNIFEDAFCRYLMDYYEARGGEDSGVMQTSREGKTVGVLDHSFKRRRDAYIEEEEGRAAVRTRLVRRLLPQIQRYLGFRVTRVERYVIACYDGQDRGFFRPHRDNTTAGTAHRRFAVTINLNADDFEGGELRFPEYGTRSYRAPTGGAVVFSCTLLHEALPVTAGRRFAFLPFVYDDVAADLRTANMHMVAR